MTRSALRCVDDLTEPPIVGRFYLVPCVELSNPKTTGMASGFWPVTGPLHGDAEIIHFPWRHWHYDYRFLSEGQYNRVVRTVAYGDVLTTTKRRFGGDKEPIAGIASATVLRSRKCVRLAPPYPHDVAEKSFGPELCAAYCEKTVTCGKCPHRGLPLSSLPREPGTNIVTCVGHGLRWDLVTGELVRPAADLQHRHLR